MSSGYFSLEVIWLKIGLAKFSDEHFCLTAEIQTLEVEKVVQNSILDQPILTGFSTSFASERRAGVDESIQI